MRRGRPPHPELLTPREQEVLNLVRRGLTNQQIADTLGITRAGAAYHVSEILSKLQVRSRDEAALLAPEEARRKLWGVAFAGLLTRLRPESPLKLAGAAVMAGGIGLLVILTIGVAIMELRSGSREGTVLACVSGEDARNPTSENGDPQQVGEIFQTVAEAEAFICQDVPQAQATGGWFVLYTVASRSHSLDAYDRSDIDPNYTRGVQIRYDNADLTSTLTLTTVPDDGTETPDWRSACRQGEGELRGIRLQGSDADVWRRVNAGYTGAIICWQARGEAHRADLVVHDASLGIESDVLPAVVRLLETVK